MCELHQTNPLLSDLMLICLSAGDGEENSTFMELDGGFQIFVTVT